MKINQFVPDTSIFDKFDSNNSTNTDSSNSLSFLDVLKQKLDEVNSDQVNADNVTQSFIEGDDVSVDQVMLSTEEAKMSLDLAIQVRNKLVDAYQELDKMQL